MADTQINRDQEPSTIDPPPLVGFHRWFWAPRHDYARLEREYRAFNVDLEFLQSRNGLSNEAWKNAAKRQMENIKGYLQNRDVEAGWVCLHAARRYAVHALNRNELQIQASALRAEATKFTSWRAKEMDRLLSGQEVQIGSDKHEVAPLRELVIKAMELRDEHFSNQYAKIWLMGSQLWTLLVCCGVGLVLLLPFLISYSRDQESAIAPWTYQVVAAVLFFGLLGAAISAAGSLMNDRASGVPERVGNQFVTYARAWFGAGSGLAGYVFYQSKLLNITVGSDHNLASDFAVAFLFGFAGERLIVRVLGSIGAEK